MQLAMCTAGDSVRSVLNLPSLPLCPSGEFFLAELIESQDSEHKTFVAEVHSHPPYTHTLHCFVPLPQEGGRAIGFISVTTQVDLGLLNSCFQLQAYHSLKHTSPPGHGGCPATAIPMSEVLSVVVYIPLTAEASALMSQSVRSIAGSDQLEESSTKYVGM